MKNILLILTLFLFSCVTNNFPNTESVDLLPLDSSAPIWQDGYVKNFTPDRKTDQNLDFYDFIKGTRYAIIIPPNDQIAQKIKTNDEYSIQLLDVVRKYLFGLGFEYVAITEDEKEELFSKFQSLCQVALVYTSMEVTSPNASTTRIGEINLKFGDCLGDEYVFYKPSSMWLQANDDYWDSLIFTKLTQLFWHNISRDENYMLELSSPLGYYSDWEMGKIKNYFDTNNLHPLEGIYEQLFAEGDVNTQKYKIAIIKTEAGYDLVYLDGASNNIDWELGDIKAEMIETATPNLYKIKWSMQFKAINDDVYAYVDEDNFFTVRFGSVASNNSDVKYLKLYPSINSPGGNNNASNPNASFANSGTGFAISQDGLIVTNYHVVDGANQIRLKSHKIGSSKTYAAEIILTDKKNDLAILKIDESTFKGFGAIPYSFKNKVSDMGTQVYTLGFPLTDTMGESLKLTDGLISSKTGFQGDISLYQVSIPVQPGNSGGPLFDYDANLIGVINAKHLKAENVTYAIKSNYLENLVELLPMPPTLEKKSLLKNTSLPNQVQSIEDFIFLIQVK